MARIVHTVEFKQAKLRYSLALRRLARVIPKNVKLVTLTDFSRWLDEVPQRRVDVREAVTEYLHSVEALLAEAMKPMARNCDRDNADEAMLQLLQGILRRNKHSIDVLGQIIAAEHRHKNVAIVASWALTSDL